MELLENAELNAALEHLNTLDPAEAVTLESLKAFSRLLVNLRGFIKRRILPSNAVVQEVYESDIKRTAKHLAKTPYSKYVDMEIQVPEGLPLDRTMDSMIAMLIEVTRDLTDVETRMLIPLEQWCSNVIATPGYGTKLWTDTRIKAADLKKIRKSLQDYYDAKLSDALSMRRLEEVYPTSKAFLDSGGTLREVVDLINEAVQGKINERVDNIAELISDITGSQDEVLPLDGVKGSTLKKVATMMYSAAEEVELLAVLTYRVQSAALGYNAALDKMR